MSRTILLSLTVLALVCSAFVVSAPEAGANGILIASGGGGRRPGPTVRPPRPVPTPLAPQQQLVTMKGHSVKALIRDNIAEVTIEQVFHNHSAQQLEGTYLFPLPRGATVSQFSMTMFGKMVRGEVIEAEQAREIYRSIVSRKRDPGLLEYMGSGLFRARVFPIMPHDDLTIRITYQQVVPEDDGTLEFRYPLATDRLNGGTPVSSVLVDVKVESRDEIKAVFSPTHSVEIVRDGEHKASASLERKGQRQSQDFLLYVGRSAGAVGLSVQSHQPVASEGTFMAVITPRTRVAKEQRQPKDVVYVLDTSGSMEEAGKMVQAQKALVHGLRTLGSADRFGVVGFASAVRPFRDQLLDANKETVEAAVKWVNELSPRGGTNISDALSSALAMRADKNRLFLVVFLTDGKPTMGEKNPDLLIKGIEGKTNGARIFTFGVGYDLDVNLLDRIAEVSGGARDYVMPEEDIEIVTSRFFRKVSSPVLQDVTVEFGEGVYDVYPRKLPALFAGSQVVVFGRYREAGDRVLRLKGTLAGKAVVHEYETTFKKGDNADYLPRLWAHRKIGYLLDEIRLHGQTKETVDEVIKLATQHAIVTPYTAGLVVEESELQGRNLRDIVSDARRRADRTAGRGGGGLPSAGAPLAEGFFRLGGRRPQAPGGASQPTDSAMPPPATPSPRMDPNSDAGKKAKAEDSEALKRMKEALEADDKATGEKDSVLDQLRQRFKTVASRTFVRGSDERWIENGYDMKAETKKVEAYSEAWFDLMGKDDKLAKILALGERLVFQHAGTWYEVVPATK
jgi:Ca-activated chloride channel family protein